MMYNLIHALRIIVIAAGLAAAAPAFASDEFDYFRAVQFDDVTTVQRLLPTLGPNLRDPQRGENGLILAVREDAMRAFNALLSAPGVDLELRANNGNTALMMAAYKHNMPAVKALLAKGARVNQPGWAPMHYAAAGGDADIVQLLAKHRAELDARTPHMQTALMLAAREGKEEAVAALLAAGANASLKNGEGLTAAQMADKADKPLIVALIAEHQAKAISKK
jgi:ankyrin repeat protein